MEKHLQRLEPSTRMKGNGSRVEELIQKAEEGFSKKKDVKRRPE